MTDKICKYKTIRDWPGCYEDCDYSNTDACPHHIPDELKPDLYDKAMPPKFSRTIIVREVGSKPKVETEAQIIEGLTKILGHYAMAFEIDGMYSEKPYVEEILAYFKSHGWKSPKEIIELRMALLTDANVIRDEAIEAAKKQGWNDLLDRIKKENPDLWKGFPSYWKLLEQEGK